MPTPQLPKKSRRSNSRVTESLLIVASSAFLCDLCVLCGSTLFKPQRSRRTQRGRRRKRRPRDRTGLFSSGGGRETRVPWRSGRSTSFLWGTGRNGYGRIARIEESDAPQGVRCTERTTE